MTENLAAKLSETCLKIRTLMLQARFQTFGKTFYNRGAEWPGNLLTCWGTTLQIWGVFREFDHEGVFIDSYL